MTPSFRLVPPRTLTGRLLLGHAVAVLGVLLVLGVVVDRVVERSFVDQLTASLTAEARAVQEALPQGDPTQGQVRALGRAVGARVTVIRTDGVVLADSEHDPLTMENHRGRPEVRQALDGRVGVASRDSATIGIAFRYVALPAKDGRIVRVALPLTTVAARVRTVRVILVVGFTVAALVGLLVLGVIGRRVAAPIRSMAEALEDHGGRTGPLPEKGTREVEVLVRTINRSREDAADRMAEVEEGRQSRETILSALAEGVVLFAADGSVLYRNEVGRALLGGAVPAAERLSPGGLRDLVAGVMGAEPSTAVEFSAVAPARTIRATATPLPGEDGSVLLVLRDVTEARRTDAVRRDFVANASHELKTPAASIRALAETIAAAAGDDPEAVPRFARQLEGEAVRLSRVISDLLDLSRLEGDAGAVEPVRLDGLVHEEGERLRPQAEEAGIRLTVDATVPVTVDGSSRDLGLMVRNLIQNAIQYTRVDGTITVELGPAEDGQVELLVRDTGIGIPARDRERVFERFYRVDRGRSRATGGTGLGLSIVKHVAENHGGSVEVRSELGQGSSFTVRLRAHAGPVGILSP